MTATGLLTSVSPADIFTTTVDVRISNRLVGDYVMTQNNIALPRNKADSIGVGDWSFDEHMTGKYAVPTGTAGDYQVMLEGNFWPSITSTGNWYDVRKPRKMPIACPHPHH